MAEFFKASGFAYDLSVRGSIQQFPDLDQILVDFAGNIFRHSESLDIELAGVTVSPMIFDPLEEPTSDVLVEIGLICGENLELLRQSLDHEWRAYASELTAEERESLKLIFIKFNT